MGMHTSWIEAGALRALRNRSRKRGSSVIEFALASMVFLAFLFGIMDFARAVYTYEFVTYAARAGARWASVRGSACGATNGNTWCEPASGTAGGATAADIQTYVQGLHLFGITSTQIAATVTWPQTGSACNTSNASNSPGCPVKVVVQYPYSSSIPFLRVTTIRLTADSEMVISE